MKSLLSTAAMILGLAGMTVTASAQTNTDGTNVVAMTMVESAVSTRLQAAEMARATQVAAMVEGIDAEATVQEVVARTLGEGAPNLTVVRTVFTSDRWIVRLNELGVPKSEYRKGVVVYHVPGMEPVVRQIAIERPYFTTSDDPATYSVRLGGLK